jgi:hypothetical protein
LDISIDGGTDTPRENAEVLTDSRMENTSQGPNMAGESGKKKWAQGFQGG